ncbi:mitochondrial ribosomal protein S26 [Columba livia]|uniref:Mitochondrial ribosomal protein S26 n=1 Tax=Columba livia TaxID=8932 RepID=A0A2I0MMH4_COLLI|nr:mitochondrial ribosomal protein S26 [Columba livia]
MSSPTNSGAVCHQHHCHHCHCHRCHPQDRQELIGTSPPRQGRVQGRGCAAQAGGDAVRGGLGGAGGGAPEADGLERTPGSGCAGRKELGKKRRSRRGRSSRLRRTRPGNWRLS